MRAWPVAKRRNLERSIDVLIQLCRKVSDDLPHILLKIKINESLLTLKVMQRRES
jgi:hypothetical protein